MKEAVRAIEDLRAEPCSASMERLINLTRNKGLDAESIFQLSKVMAESGARLNWPAYAHTADLASTGGPSSLSTLLVPLYLRAMGCIIPKLGVPGRPAGGVDVLAQLNGYRINLSEKEVYEVIERCGYAHFLACSQFSPLDAALFRYRQKVGAQNLPDLVIASLLSKKISCGVRTVGLDVRVARHGNFGSNFDDARAAAAKYCEVASYAGINAVCFLTDARYPFQQFIGRGESLVATKQILDGNAMGSLSNHNDQCLSMAVKIGSLIRLPEPLGTPDIQKVFKENLQAQGSSWGTFENKVDTITAGHNFHIVATNDGFYRVNLASLRELFMELNPTSAGRFLDCFGIILESDPETFVRRYESLASVRIKDHDWPEVESRLNSMFSFEESPPAAVDIEIIVDHHAR